MFESMVKLASDMALSELVFVAFSKRWITSYYMSHVLSRPGRTVPSFRRTQCTCNGLTYPKPRLNHGKAFLLIISPQPIVMTKQKAVQMEADYLQCSGEGGISRLLIHQWWSWAVMGSGQGVKKCANLQIWLIW